MDPDMVRQQEEAEAASHSPRPNLEPSPALAGAQPLVEDYPFTADFRGAPPDSGAPPQQEKAGQRGVWFTALLATVLTVIGLSQGLKLGANLSLVPVQALAAGALGGVIAGWGGTGLWLRLRHRLSWGRAIVAAFLPTTLATIVMMASMKLADRYWAIAPRELAVVMEEYQAGVFILSGGALIAYLLAFQRLRKASRR